MRGRTLIPLVVLLAACETSKDSTGSTAPTGTTAASTGTPSTPTGTATGSTPTGSTTPDALLTPTPASLTFVPGCPATEDVVIQNTGEQIAEVSAVALSGDPEFTVSGAPPSFPAFLPIGQNQTLSVTYTPADTADATGTLVVATEPMKHALAIPLDTAADLGPQVDHFTATGGTAIDVIVMSDKSGSVVDELDAFAQSGADFVAEVDAVAPDWRISVVSLATGCPTVILDPSMPTAGADFRDAVTDLNPFATYSEALFETLGLTLDQTGGSRCASGAVRTGVPLLVVFLTDEPHQGGPWQIELSVLQARFPSPSDVMLSGFLDLNSACGAGAGGYVDAVRATGGVARDICGTDWVADVAAVAASAQPAGQAEFVLSTVPDQATLAVTVDGVPSTTWTWDAGQNAVVFPTPLSDGEAIEVRYTGVACWT